MRHDPTDGPPRPRMPRGLHEFAELVDEARDPTEIGHALVSLAGRLAGASRVELLADGPGTGPPRRLAAWPSPSGADPSAPGSPWPSSLGPRSWPAPELGDSEAPSASLPLRCGGRTWAELRIWADRPRPVSSRVLRRLATLGTLAAAGRVAEAGNGPQPPPSVNGCDPVTGLYGPTFLDGFLAHCLSQARRRREPLSLLCLEPDRLEAIVELLGRGAADEALRRVARATVATLRASDLVARLDGDRLLAVLPSASASDAPAVAEAVRRAVIEAGSTWETMPLLTASIGVVSSPHDGETAPALQTAALAALGLARRLGRNRVAASPRSADPEAEPRPTAQRAG